MPTLLVDLLQYTGKKGGIEAYIFELYNQFGKFDTNWKFIALASSEFSEVIDNSWFPGEVINSGISGENRFAWAWSELFLVSKFAKKINADLIHCPAMLGPLKSNIPVVVTIHDLSYFTHPELMKTKRYTNIVKVLEKIASKTATKIIAISKTTAQLIPIYLSVPSNKIDVILSAGRNIDVFNNVPNQRSSSIFLAMGQRSPYKSLETAIQAWALIPKEHRPKLIVTGSHGNDPLKKLVEELSLIESVNLLEWVTDKEINELIANCTAIIETTRAAGFGMPALEAMTAGTPVIISDIPVFREIAGEAAEYFEPGDSESLAETVKLFINSPQRQAELQELGPKWASKYSWEKTALSTLRTFNSAIEK